MSETPTEEILEELRAALRNNDGQLGKVFALLEEGKTTNRELVEGAQQPIKELRRTFALLLK